MGDLNFCLSGRIGRERERERRRIVMIIYQTRIEIEVSLFLANLSLMANSKTQYKTMLIIVSK